MKVALLGATGFVGAALLKEALKLLVDATGKSEISVQDYAVAMIDELERPAHVRRRFTVGY
jgi:putative NADH-flavin reductase